MNGSAEAQRIMVATEIVEPRDPLEERMGHVDRAFRQRTNTPM